MHVEPLLGAHVDSSKVWLCKKAVQGLKISPQAWCTTAQRKSTMGHDQLVSDPSTYVKKRTQRQNESILLRHTDDVDDTAPEEHLMSDLTNVVVLRNEGDTVNCWALEITMTSSGFEVINSTELAESLLSLDGWENLKPTANPGRRSIVMELASAIPLQGHDYSNFRSAVGKTHLDGTWRTDMQFAFQQLSTQALNPTTEKHPRGETVALISQRCKQHLSSSRTTHTHASSNRND